MSLPRISKQLVSESRHWPKRASEPVVLNYRYTPDVKNFHRFSSFLISFLRFLCVLCVSAVFADNFTAEAQRQADQLAKHYWKTSLTRAPHSRG